MNKKKEKKSHLMPLHKKTVNDAEGVVEKFGICQVRNPAKTGAIYGAKLEAAAVSRSAVPYRFSAGGIRVGVDGQAGPCMGRCMGRCMGGVWLLPGLGVGGRRIGEIGSGHWEGHGLVMVR